MPDEPSLGEVVRRLARLEELLLRLVSTDLYTRDQREMERRFAELEGDIKELQRRAEKRDDSTGANVRQAIYAGLVPTALFLITILLQLKGGR